MEVGGGLGAVVAFPVHDDAREHADGHEVFLEGGVGVEMGGDAMAGEVVVYCQLVVLHLSTTQPFHQVLQPMQQPLEHLWHLILVLLFLVDAVFSILELKAVVLDPTIGEFFPGLVV